MPTIGAAPDTDARAADQLGEAVIALVHAWREMDRRSPELNQSALAILEMARLIGEGEHRMSEIAERRGVDQSVISRQISDLQRKHLVCRRPDPTDGRASLVRLTPKGLQVLANVQNLRNQWLRDALARVPVADVEAATALVSALADELRTHGPEIARLATPS
jgi:DNA-binding MarR family transcriptional regulator